MTEEILNYRNTAAVSYSLLSAMESNPKSLIDTKREDKDYFTFGSLVDCLAFTPDLFNEQFLISGVNKPTEKMGEVFEEFLKCEIPPTFELHDVSHLILGARARIGYNPKMNDITFLEKFNEACLNYWDVITKAGEREVISQQVYDKALKYVNRLHENPYTSKYLKKSERGVELFFQVPLFYKIEGVDGKSLIDCLYINHEKKLIRVLDLKTTGDSSLWFESSFLKFKYYLQAALYLHAVKETVLPGYPGYSLDNEFRFIVIDEYSQPIIWKVPQQLNSISWVGGITRGGKKIKGIYQLLEEYKWHTENMLFDYPPSIYQNEGEKLIDVL